MKLGKKGNLKNLLFSKFTLAALLAMCAYLSVSVYQRYTVEREMATRRAEAEQEYRALEARRDTLLDKVEYLKGDSGIESEIRKNFDVAGAGEQVVIIVDDEADEQIVFTEGSSPENPTLKKWWQFWR